MNCSELNRKGEPCGAPESLVDRLTGKCPAHRGVDMRELGAAGAAVSHALKRKQRRKLNEIVADELERQADSAYRRLRAAIDAGDRDTAFRVVAEAFDMSPRDTAEQQMRERRAESMRNGSRWRDTEDDYEDF